MLYVGLGRGIHLSTSCSCGQLWEELVYIRGICTSATRPTLQLLPHRCTTAASRIAYTTVDSLSWDERVDCCSLPDRSMSSDAYSTTGSTMGATGQHYLKRSSGRKVSSTLELWVGVLGLSSMALGYSLTGMGRFRWIDRACLPNEAVGNRLPHSFRDQEST